LIRRTVAPLLAVAAIVCVIAAVRVGPGASTSTDVAAGTPAWSARRVPVPIADAVAQFRLRDELAAILAGTAACVVVDGPPGRIVDLAGSTPLIPASTIKILTAIGALVTLPDGHRFVTTVVADGVPSGSTIPAVALVGGGDPLLGTPEWVDARAADPLTAGTSTTPLAALADQLVERGVSSIPGGVVGVAARWSTEPTSLDGWPASYRTNAIGPVVSLTVNGGFRGVGDPATNAPLFAAEELTRLLRDRGVEVGAPSTAGTAPRGTVLATVESAPLVDIVGEMLAVSDNLTAEVVVREIAAARGASSTDDGVAIIREELASLGLPLEGFDQRDGSGLSRASRVPCTLLSAALVLTEQPRFAPVRAGLAVAGERGTLARVLLDTDLAGRLVAKTGTLPGVSGLAGFVEVGVPLRFAMLANGDFGESAAVPLRERVAQSLGRYPDAPAGDDLVPSP